MHTIQRIGVLSAAKMHAVVMLAVGVLVGLIYGAILVGAGLIAMMGGSGGGSVGLLVGGVAFAFVFPLLYAALGFLIGALTAWVYNLAAGYIGGVEIELGQDDSMAHGS